MNTLVMTKPAQSTDGNKSAPAVRAPAGTGASKFEAVLAEYETPLLRYTIHLLGSRSDAEDVVQETFLKLHQQMQTAMEETHNIQAWLFRVAHNTAYDVLRKRRSKERAEETLSERIDADCAPDAVGALIHEAACKEALAELQKLPDDEREIILLKIIKGFPHRDISEMMGCSIGNVDYKLNQGLRTLAMRLKKRGVI
jgi:RNA polymerase sigma-70 factor, ECF subfamily